MKNHLNRLPHYLLVVVLISILAVITPCQTQSGNTPPVLDAKMRQELIENIVRELRSKYVVAEKVKDIESGLRARVQSGAYDKIVNVREFASTLTQDLRAIAKDLHLFV